MGLDLTGIGSVADLVKDGMDRILGPSANDEQKAQAAALMAQLNAHLQIAEAQLKVDATEAANPSVFVAGWRPFCGWVCGSAFAWVFVGQPVCAFVLAALHQTVTLPSLDLSQMMPVLLGMLGLGGMRSAERMKGTPTKGPSDG